MNKYSLLKRVAELLAEPNPAKKAAGVFQLYWDHQQNMTIFEPCDIPACEAGRPEKPELVSPKDCAPRQMASLEGRRGLIHALAHIEFNAINLALDACCRYQDMPEQYYQDWLQVAKEEAYHFKLLQSHLNGLGKDYGDYPAHNGLWEMAQRTAHSCLARMGCVPRLLEARGLDVAPGMAAKLKPLDANAATLLEIIMRDEQTHVKIGNHWFHYLCKQQGLEPLETFKQLVSQYAPNCIRKPVDKQARLEAGFQADEVDWIESVMI